MAGERLVRAVFTRAGRCRLCHALVAKRVQLAHAGRHLQRIYESGLLNRDDVHAMTVRQ